jgi:hypothetical protein
MVSIGNFASSAQHYVILITDKDHPRYGQIGSLVMHDWREAGVYDTCFADGGREDVPDEMCSQKTPAKKFYRRHDDDGVVLDASYQCGPRTFQQEALATGRTLDDLAKDYFKLFREELPCFKK